MLEDLWKAAYVFHAEGTKKAEEWVFDRLRRVLQGKASTVAGGIRRRTPSRDTIVGIENAAEIFGAAKPPRSFISRMGAAPLLTHTQHAAHVASMLEAWA